MKLSKQFLKRAIRQINKQRGDCISDELLIEFASGNVSKEQYQQIIDHLECCSKCAELWRSYNAFNMNKIYEVPDFIKGKMLRNIYNIKRNLLMNLLKSRYFAVAASVLLIISIVIISHMYIQNRNFKILLAQKQQRIEQLNKSNSETIAQIASLQNVLRDKEQDILRKQSPIINVPIYDLFPEGYYQRSDAERKSASIVNKNNMPFHLILNLPKELKGKCTIQVLDSGRKVMWSNETVCNFEDIITIFIPANTLAPGEYTIEVKDLTSSRLLVSYKFALRSN
jgi:cell division protein FtsB